MKYFARIIINDQANDGFFSKSFILKLYKMGAEVTVRINDKPLYLEENDNYKYFKNYK